MFHPNRPCVIWSSVENRLASRNGASEEVDEVMAKVRCFVTAAMAEMGCAVNVSSVLCFRAGQRHTIDGSVTGHCAARRMHSSSFPWYVSCPPKVSARNRALIPPRSRSFASSIQYSRLRLVADLSLGFCAQLGQSGFQRRRRRRRRRRNQLHSYFPLAGGQVSHGAHIKCIQQNVFLASPASGSSARAISHFVCRSGAFLSTLELADPIR